MCRLFALRANRPTRVRESLLTSPTSLARQSVCDRRRECHDNGWGVGYYQDDEPLRIRSTAPAGDDAHYRQVVETVAASSVLAHIRKASAGGVAERNSHPFRYGRWLFAHNGTLFGFDAAPERLRERIPAHLRSHIEGETDSEHAFYLLLSQLKEPDGATTAAELCRALNQTIHILANMYPGSAAKPSQLNFAITDGRCLAASRWGHSLWWLERHQPSGVNGDSPIDHASGYRAIVVASEPTTDESWSEVPDRSLVCVTEDLRLKCAAV